MSSVRGTAVSALAVAAALFAGCVQDNGLAPPSFSNVTELTATGSDRQVVLTWTNPSAGFDHVVLRRSTEAPPATLKHGELAYEGPGSSFVDTVDNLGLYHYTAFAVAISGTASRGVSTTATTEIAGTLDPRFADGGVGVFDPSAGGNEKPTALLARDAQIIVVGTDDATGITDPAGWVLTQDGGALSPIAFPIEINEQVPTSIVANGDGYLIGGSHNNGTDLDGRIWAVTDLFTIDNNYNPGPTDGRVELVASGNEVVRQLVNTPNGVLAVGTAGDGGGQSLALWKRQPMGAADPTFDGDGFFTYAELTEDRDVTGVGMTFDGDGRLLISGTGVSNRGAGEAQMLLWRFLEGLHADGSFNRFGVNGPTHRESENVALSINPATGHILAAGNTRHGVADDMTLIGVDPVDAGAAEFGDGGQVYADGTAGGVVVGSSVDVATSMVVGPEGRIYVAGASASRTVGPAPGDLDAVVWAFEPNGQPLRSFGDDGVVVLDVAGDDDMATAVTLDENGLLVVVGTTNDGMTKDDLIVWRLFP